MFKGIPEGWKEIDRSKLIRKDPEVPNYQLRSKEDIKQHLRISN